MRLQRLKTMSGNYVRLVVPSDADKIICCVSRQGLSFRVVTTASAVYKQPGACVVASITINKAGVDLTYIQCVFHAGVVCLFAIIGNLMSPIPRAHSACRVSNPSCLTVRRGRHLNPPMPPRPCLSCVRAKRSRVRRNVVVWTLGASHHLRA